MLLFVGWVIPTLILAAGEEPSRYKALMPDGGSPIYLSSKALLLYSFALLTLAAGLAFDIAVLLVQWLW
jgi:hypothetical protein